MLDIMGVQKDEGPVKIKAEGNDILDVAETNPRARALYLRLGFKPEQSMRCRNPRAAEQIPGSTRMVLDLLAY